MHLSARWLFVCGILLPHVLCGQTPDLLLNTQLEDGVLVVSGIPNFSPAPSPTPVSPLTSSLGSGLVVAAYYGGTLDPSSLCSVPAGGMVLALLNSDGSNNRFATVTIGPGGALTVAATSGGFFSPPTVGPVPTGYDNRQLGTAN